MPERTFDEVIEAHRQAIGAAQVRVSLGPEATPDGLAAALEGLRRTGAVYASFTELEREQAKVYRLSDVLRRVSRLTTTPFEGLPPEEVQRRMSEIFALTDLVPDVDLEGDIAWMRAERDRRGQPQPALPAQE
ncbi:hypothetical protein IQ03_03948 [Gemmobacter caeni]|uniref:Uncharacterized protein n=1 Tax=Gemmobacter caeni TaxID=589035 RepID=A0A2T6B994_9RHOB|nr:hypothetical protein [Gemmobacter caeni]PTX52623.1 hypothetical protein C8N34_102411 [Gemmobacter caeni]TWI94920.1 hypothetical protein IQ03_03948 [Gemmobacter caeni]